MAEQTSTPSGANELEELVRAMTPAQKLRFKQAVVRQVIHFVSKRLPPEEEDDGHRGGIIVATNWLNEPTDEKARDASSFAASECWDGGARYDDYPKSFLDPADVAGATDLCSAARIAAQAAPPTEQEEARQWQIAAAQAILQGQEPLPIV